MHVLLGVLLLVACTLFQVFVENWFYDGVDDADEDYEDDYEVADGGGCDCDDDDYDDADDDDDGADDYDSDDGAGDCVGIRPCIDTIVHTFNVLVFYYQ